MASIINIINTLRNSHFHLRTLDHMWVDHDTICSGNNAVTARCSVIGRQGYWLIKCYFRKKNNLKAIYGDNYYCNELGIYSPTGCIEYIDIVLLPWVEGVPLNRFIGNPTTDYRALSRAFDKLALQLLESEYAHGDIKPDNIIVGHNLEMSLIDLDAMWRPEFGNSLPTECGTAAYQHPKRKLNYYNKFIDDYPLAIISSMLAALALDRELEHKLDKDKILFDSDECIYGDSRILSRVIDLFDKHNDMAHKQIAIGLRSSSLMIYGLHKMFYTALNGNDNGYSTPKHLDIAQQITPIKSGAHRHPAPHYSMNSGQRIRSKWTRDEELLLATLLFDGNRLSNIAIYMGRSEKAIRQRIKELNLPLSALNLRKPIRPRTKGSRT